MLHRKEQSSRKKQKGLFERVSAGDGMQLHGSNIVVQNNDRGIDEYQTLCCSDFLKIMIIERHFAKCGLIEIVRLVQIVHDNFFSSLLSASGLIILSKRNFPDLFGVR